MAADQVAAELVAELERALEIDPRAVPPARRPWSRAASRRRHRPRTRCGRPRRPRSTTVRQTPEQAIEAPTAMQSRVIAAGDREAAQAFGRALDRKHLADVGDDAGEHGSSRSLERVRACRRPTASLPTRSQPRRCGQRLERQAVQRIDAVGADGLSASETAPPRRPDRPRQAPPRPSGRPRPSAA